MPKPISREGRLTDNNLQQIRAALKEVASAGLIDRPCEADWRRVTEQGGKIIGLGVEPEFLLANFGRDRIASPERPWCQSPAARRLTSLLDRLF
jgi:hypothetical protein